MKVIVLKPADVFTDEEVITLFNEIMNEYNK